MIQTQELPKKLRILRLASLSAYCGLIFAFLLSCFFIFEEFRLSIVFIWLIQILPMLLFFPGLYKARLRSYGWMSCVLLFYFIHGVLIAFNPAQRYLGLLELFFCVLLFVFLILFIKEYRSRFQVPL